MEILVATSNISILKTELCDPGPYQLRVYKPFWHPKYFYKTFFCLQPLFDVPEHQMFAFRSMGPGASKFQSVSLAFENIRDRFLKSFDLPDRFSVNAEEFDLNGVMECLLTDRFDEGFVVKKQKQLRNKLAEVRLVAYHKDNREKMDLDLKLAQPYLVDDIWWCPFQIHSKEAFAVSGQDSFRALRKAFAQIANWFCENLDDNWNVVLYEDGKAREYTYAETRKWLFPFCPGIDDLRRLPSD